MVMAALASYAITQTPQNPQRKLSVRKTRDAAPQRNGSAGRIDSLVVKAQPKLENEDSIPDSLLHPRWKIQRTLPITLDDLDQNAADLKRPDNLKQDVVYNDSLDRYIIGSKISDSYINAPFMMTQDEYRKWSERRMMNQFFRKKNDEIYQAKGKEKFDFTDMHFDLGPAEKIFGPGGVRIKTQGTAELKFGATMKSIDNPSLPVRNRKTTTMDFDEKINVSLNGRVGDKVNMNLNYNTDATFDFDAQSLKLKYDGKEDEIVKLIEAGNVSFPSNSSLVRGASSLFGLRTDLQFGKLKLQLVASQKKSSSKSVSSKGGKQFTPFEIDAANYEENRHFFLAQYFHDRYDESMRSLPNLTSGVTINRVEVWVTNKSGNTSNTRNIIALTDLGENNRVSNNLWGITGQPVPANAANSEYAAMTSQYAAARDIDQTSTVLDGIAGFVGGSDYEKLERARLLNSSEYTVNKALGYISLKTSLQTDQVLAVAYEYTYGGVTYQVGEFASDITDSNKALYVKALKNTSNNPHQGNWGLMMKNVYYLASSVEKEKFRLDVKFQSDTAGVYLTYIPEPQVKNQTLIKFLGADRLDNNNKAHPNGYFDYVEGYTVTNGRVFFPVAEPFGSYMYETLLKNGVAADKAAKYAFTELYDSTKTVAKQIAEKDKYVLMGQFRGTSANVISLGAYNIPQGSVGYGRRRNARRRHRLLRRLLGRRGDYPQPEHHRRRHLRERVARKQYRLRTGTQDDVRHELGVRLLEGLPALGYVPAPLRTGAHQQGEHGIGAAQQHYLGLEHQLEEAEPVAHEHARQAAVPASYATVEHLVLGRVRATHSRTEQRHAGQRLVHRRLREHQEHHRRVYTYVVDNLVGAVDVPRVGRQGYAAFGLQPLAPGVVHHRPALHTPLFVAHSEPHQERPRPAV